MMGNKLEKSGVRRVMVSGLVMMMMMMSRLASVRGQKCGCKAELCCSKYGYCGSGDEYCGRGCKEGACYGSGNHISISVSEIVTSEFFDGIMDEAEEHCPGKNFYSRNAFLDALVAYDQFAITSSLDDSKREIAAAFAHFTHQTTHFCYIEEIEGASKDYCNKSFSQYPCAHEKGYYGRGPIQLSWNFNYGPAGDNNGFDGLNAPETVASDPVISFKTALWYWTQFISPLMKKGFGETIRAINGKLECDGANPQNVQARLSYYTQYCSLLGVAPGHNLTC